MSKITDVIGESMAKIKDFIDVNTIVGDPITTPDGTTLIPVSKVTFGFAAGGTDADAAKNPDKTLRFGAGSGAGVSITPVAFMVISGGNVRMIYVAPSQTPAVDRLIDMVPDILEKFNKKNETEEITY